MPFGANAQCPQRPGAATSAMRVSFPPFTGMRQIRSPSFPRNTGTADPSNRTGNGPAVPARWKEDRVRVKPIRHNGDLGQHHSVSLKKVPFQTSSNSSRFRDIQNRIAWQPPLEPAEEWSIRGNLQSGLTNQKTERPRKRGRAACRLTGTRRGLDLGWRAVCPIGRRGRRDRLPRIGATPRY
jgi:hypothetical protein